MKYARMEYTLYIAFIAMTAHGAYSNHTHTIILYGGVKVQYKGHLPGGNIAIEYAGDMYIINPNATKELSQR